VDQPRLEEIKIDLTEKVRKAEAECFELFQCEPFNLNSNPQLKEKLNAMGIPAESVGAKELCKYDSPIIKVVKGYKTFAKLRNTYAEKIGVWIDPRTNRVHANFGQYGTVTGRLNCSLPNLQQQPSKYAPWRTIFTAEEGNTLVIADLSQIEMRILGDVSGETEFINALANGEDLYILTATKIFKKPAGEITKRERAIAKQLNFGLSYGLTHYGLISNLKKEADIDLTEDEAKDLIKAFKLSYPKLARYLVNISYEGARSRQLRNLAGRLLNLDPNMKFNSALRESMNTPIQSLCADMLKIALRDLYLTLETNGVKFVNTVHDEVVFECSIEEAEEVKAIVKEIMERAGNRFLKHIKCIADAKISREWVKD
jgi:DNA polymerase I